MAPPGGKCWERLVTDLACGDSCLVGRIHGVNGPVKLQVFWIWTVRGGCWLLSITFLTSDVHSSLVVPFGRGCGRVYTSSGQGRVGVLHVGVMSMSSTSHAISCVCACSWSSSRESRIHVKYWTERTVSCSSTTLTGALPEMRLFCLPPRTSQTKP